MKKLHLLRETLLGLSQGQSAAVAGGGAIDPVYTFPRPCLAPTHPACITWSETPSCRCEPA